MNIGVFLCADLERAQYIYKYVDLLERLQCSYDIVYWNRNLSDFTIDCKAKLIPYDEKIDSYQPLLYKTGAYLRFRRFVKKVIKENSYDKIILLTTPMAVSVFDVCFRQYKGKYLFDFRDLTKEYFMPYRKLVQRLVCKSGLFVTSSPGYLSYFDEDKIPNYVLCHNTLGIIRDKKKLELKKEFPIRIAYWGAVRQVEYNKKICDLFGNDERFVFTYHGDGAFAELQNYCTGRGITNINFTGRYSLEEIEMFARDADILFNAYETDFVTMPSLAVKVYDSLEYQLPMVVSRKSFMEKYLKKYSHVFPFRLEEGILDKLWEWYRSLEQFKTEQSFEKLKQKIQKDDIEFEKKVKAFVEI